MSVVMRFGMLLATVPPYELFAERVRRVESLGFDSLWLGDHLTQFPGGIDFEAWSLLGALARETRRVRIGTLVTPPAFRHPTLLAMAAITVDHASGGRLEIGIGAGGYERDQAALGLPQWEGKERLDRMEEQLEIIDRLLRGETVTREGRYYATADAAVARPVQQPRPPFVIAAQAPRTLRLVAKYGDAWSTEGGQPSFGSERRPLEEAVALTRRQAETLDEACHRIGRDPSTVRRLLLVYKQPVFASLDAFEELVGRYREVGIEEFVCIWPYRGEPETLRAREAVLERAALEVIPRLRGA